METVAENTKAKRKSLRQQFLEVAPVVYEVIVLFVCLFYDIAVAMYKKIYPPLPKSVNGEIVLITGAGHGIGRELAIFYSHAGATVVCWDINEEGNKNTIKEILKEGGRKPHSYVCDVSNREQVLEVAAKVKKEVGDVTILVNNAGIMPTHPIEAHSAEEIRKTFDINILAHFWTLEAFLPTMKELNRGHIVSLASIAGFAGLANLVPYCATKFAVRGAMESLAEELRQNKNNKIKTTTVFPYMVNTGLCKNPNVRFKNFMAMLDPKYVAKQIIHGQRTNAVEVPIPPFILPLNSFIRLVPYKSGLRIRDFIGSSMESDL